MKKINFLSGKIIDVIGGGMLTIMILLTMFNVFSDWVFDKRYGALEEVVLAAFVWVVYVGVGELYKTDDHISVDMLDRFIRGKAQYILRLIIDVVVLIVSIFITYYAFNLTVRSVTKFTAILKIRYVYMDTAVVIGFAMTVIHAIPRIIKNVKMLLKKDGEK